MATQSQFGAALFDFLEALRSNNSRAWFQAHTQRYGREVRDPMLRFIGDFRPHLWQISPRFVAAKGTSGGDSLTRHPSGYDPKHPLLADLKRKDYIALAHFTQEQACAPDFLHVFTETCRTFAPLTQFLTTALELAW